VVSATNVDASLEDMRAPGIARLADGNFVINWVTAHGDSNIRAQIFRPDGTRVGGELGVNASGGINVRPGIAGFLLGWTIEPS
jgi:hypothetical protein